RCAESSITPIRNPTRRRSPVACPAWSTSGTTSPLDFLWNLVGRPCTPRLQPRFGAESQKDRNVPELFLSDLRNGSCGARSRACGYGRDPLHVPQSLEPL